MSSENLQKNKIGPVTDEKGKIIPGLFIFEELSISEEDRIKIRSEIMDLKTQKLVQENEKFL